MVCLMSTWERVGVGDGVDTRADVDIRPSAYLVRTPGPRSNYREEIDPGWQRDEWVV